MGSAARGNDSAAGRFSRYAAALYIYCTHSIYIVVREVDRRVKGALCLSNFQAVSRIQRVLMTLVL